MKIYKIIIQKILIINEFINTIKKFGYLANILFNNI